MIPILSFDLSTMSIWFDPTMISRHPERDYLSKVLNEGLLGNLQDAVKETAAEGIQPETRGWAVDLLSSIWHEQRHFFDFSLTNYGAFRFRQFLEIYVNAGTIMLAARENNTPLVLPIDAVLDPVRRELLNIQSLPEFEALATAISKRKRISSVDRQTVPIDGQLYELGGEAIFEALAYLAQLVGIQEYFGGDLLFAVQESVPEQIRKSQKYNWFIRIGQHFGLITGSEIGNHRSSVNLGPFLPVLYASLFTRHWEKEKGDETYSKDLPSYRLYFLITEIIKDREGYLKLDLQEQWDFVNRLCKQHFGRTVIEELEVDVQKEEGLLEKVKAQNVLADVQKIFEDYHSMRIWLLRIFKSAPLSIIDPVLFVKHILPVLRPRPILAYPGGLDQDLPGWVRAFGFVENEHKWVWAYVPEGWFSRRECITLEEHDAWSRMISHYAPLAKMMINGRKHKTMLGPELLASEKMWQHAEVPLIFDPLFEFPVEKNGMSYYYHLTKQDSAVCDLCRKSIRKPDGFLLTPWWFRYSVRNAEVAIQAYEGGEKGRYRFYQDWSYWVVCDECLKDLRQHFDWQD